MTASVLGVLLYTLWLTGASVLWPMSCVCLYIKYILMIYNKYPSLSPSWKFRNPRFRLCRARRPRGVLAKVPGRPSPVFRAIPLYIYVCSIVFHNIYRGYYYIQFYPYHIIVQRRTLDSRGQILTGQYYNNYIKYVNICNYPYLFVITRVKEAQMGLFDKYMFFLNISVHVLYHF